MNLTGDRSRSPIRATINEVHHHRPMPEPTDYLAALQSYMEPSNGTVSYTYARICAQLLHLSDQFVADYSCMEGHRVDVGEFNVWALNLL